MPNKLNQIFGWCVAGVIIAAIIGGLLMVGGPAKARDQKIDAKRLINMHMTARVLSCYADKNDGLPLALAPARKALEDNHVSFVMGQRCRNLKWKTDPVTQAEFEYNRLGDNNFELCGVFEREGDAKSGQSNRNFVNYYNRSENVLNTKASRKSGGRHCYVSKSWTKP